MKNLSIIILLLFLLIGCSNAKTFDESINILEDEGYDIKIYEKESFFNINGINRIVAEKEDDVLYIATIYYLRNEEDAKKFFEIINNIYMEYIYSPDIYGFNNSYKLYYNLINEPYISPEYQDINWDLLNSLEGSKDISIYLFDDLEKWSTLPNVFIPKTYEEFKKKQNYYTPQCFIKGNIVYIGSPKILDLLS